MLKKIHTIALDISIWRKNCRKGFLETYFAKKRCERYDRKIQITNHPCQKWLDNPIFASTNPITQDKAVKRFI